MISNYFQATLRGFMRINPFLKPTAVCCALAAFHTFAWADLIVPVNGVNSLNSGYQSLACTQLSVSGQLNLNTGTLVRIKNSMIQTGGVVNGNSGLLEVNGNWSNSGTFNPGTSTVKFTRLCGVSTINVTGTTDFGNLIIDSADGPLHIVLPPNTNQTVNGTLSFVGNPKDIYIEGGPCSGIRLLEGANSVGQDANVHLAPGVWIGKTPPAGCPGGPPVTGNSNAVPVPATDALGLGLLTALLAALGGGSLLRRKKPRAH
ncbi:hypothetical protein G7048_13315 [Diaphorobacter sp. HDW4B]|uniref:hypothetical protein n=1 Tax=Diaphorobacter sp. HDW4B TaxID=2714925 RepID=UPI0014084AC5|nr:hypothetical protein [Diaphorobacter sp. HDW4B]QIL71253.1 hypothetical protein G7048_13315 [Diaphorobacter sp. HDW4B]